ncbi:hypothetical protein J6590_102608, partial [Homalodisca vitripennis]
KILGSYKKQFVLVTMIQNIDGGTCVFELVQRPEDCMPLFLVPVTAAFYSAALKRAEPIT